MLHTLKFSLLLAALMFSNVALAQSVEEDEQAYLETITYQDRTSNDAPVPTRDAPLTASFQRLGYIDGTEDFSEVLEKTGGPGAVFYTSDFAKLFIVRYDVTPEDRNLVGRVLKTPGGHFLVHTKNRDGRSLGIYFEGFNQVGLNPILALFRQVAEQKKKPSTFSIVTDLFINHAYAQADCPGCQMASSAANWVVDGAAAVASWFVHKCFIPKLKMAMGSIESFGQSVKTLTISQAISFVRTAANAFGNAASIWNIAKKLYMTVQDTITTVVEISEGARIDWEKIKPALCDVAIAGMVGLAVGVVTGGLGSGSLAKSLGEKLANFAKEIYATLKQKAGAAFKLRPRSGRNLVIKSVQGATDVLRTKPVQYALKAVQTGNKVFDKAHINRGHNRSNSRSAN